MGLRNTLYRHYNKAGALLYVGASIRPFGRLEAHEYSFWADEIVTVTMDRFEAKDEMWQAEIDAIESEFPLHNRVAVQGDICSQRAALKDVTPKTKAGDILKSMVMSTDGLTFLQIRNRIRCSKVDLVNFISGVSEPKSSVVLSAWRHAEIRIPMSAWAETVNRSDGQ